MYWLEMRLHLSRLRLATFPLRRVLNLLVINSAAAAAAAVPLSDSTCGDGERQGRAGD
jgi:hypothetical protein